MRDPAHVPAVAAAALGVREQRGIPVAEAVARTLAGQQVLLVLDNCEHVIGAVAEFCAGLLPVCDELRVLATSREALHVAGEARYRLAPLTPAQQITADIPGWIVRTAGTALTGALLDIGDLAAAERACAAGIAQCRAAGDPWSLAKGLMSLTTAAEYALMLTAPDTQPQEPPELAGLSARERELVTLVARGRTDAQIAAELFISVRTVNSHLDRIRDKTGARRRADLTRLALAAGLV